MVHCVSHHAIMAPITGFANCYSSLHNHKYFSCLLQIVSINYIRPQQCSVLRPYFFHVREILGMLFKTTVVLHAVLCLGHSLLHTWQLSLIADLVDNNQPRDNNALTFRCRQWKRFFCSVHVTRSAHGTANKMSSTRKTETVSVVLPSVTSVKDLMFNPASVFCLSDQ